MIENKKYGVIYTPPALADFVSELLFNVVQTDDALSMLHRVIDPACGDGALLHALKKKFKDNIEYFGIDVDTEAVNAAKKEFTAFCDDSICPENASCTASDYWKKRLGEFELLIANPPWSAKKIYSKSELSKFGFEFVNGQYDSYVLFIELGFKIVKQGGYLAFIIPDSLFDAQNEQLRRFLATSKRIRVIARLGEKIFTNINRATTIIICQNCSPTDKGSTLCFRLTTENRREFLKNGSQLASFFDTGKHAVLQSRFISNKTCNFDIDTRAEEEMLINKIKACSLDMNKLFQFGRGVEISKTGEVTVCSLCGAAQGYTKKQIHDGQKRCISCGETTPVNNNTIKNVIACTPGYNFAPIIVGEDIHRYTYRCRNFVEIGLSGINYKDDSLYIPPKILIRKTGLGIYASLENSQLKTSQTVYMLEYVDQNISDPLEYYLALLNSRVVYYYYIKIYGENEWKSHPYLTKQIIFSLPLIKYSDDELSCQIVALSSRLCHNYNHILDVELENLIMDKYNLSMQERQIIISEMNSLPNLKSVNNMKIQENI